MKESMEDKSPYVVPQPLWKQEALSIYEIEEQKRRQAFEEERERAKVQMLRLLDYVGAPCPEEDELEWDSEFGLTCCFEKDGVIFSNHSRYGINGLHAIRHCPECGKEMFYDVSSKQALGQFLAGKAEHQFHEHKAVSEPEDTASIEARLLMVLREFIAVAVDEG